MNKRRYLIALVGLCLAVTLAVVLRQGYVPGSLSPLPAIDLSVARPWFADWRLAGIRNDRQHCRIVMREPHVSIVMAPDQPLKDGCGLTNGVRTQRLGNGIRVVADRMTCEVAAALSLWLEHEVQPAAREHLGVRVTGITHLGTYACRNINTTGYASVWRSEHATANAIDISGFTLSDGRTITVRQHWGSGAREQAFLRDVHARACRYFRVAIGPAYNALHADHFHYDRGPLMMCR
ncbi:MAG: extensin family protein [Hyphomicrobiales bacterium]|nr:extensin family protein [Hyphomicrobiales bacterium]